MRFSTPILTQLISRKRVSRFFAALLILLALNLGNKAIAQTPLPSGITPVIEDFNGMGTAALAVLPANWKASAAGVTADWTTGTNVTVTTQQANAGTPTTGGIYNWGTTPTTDRALGFMTSGAYASPNTILAFYSNTSGAQISDLTIGFDLERYRINTSTVSVAFFTSLDGTAWTARAAGDIAASDFTTGPSAYDFSASTFITKSFTLSGINIPSASPFYLRWVFTSGTPASSQGIGLDNVSLLTSSPVLTSDLADLLTNDPNNNNIANPGETITYKNTITNTGNGNANNVVITPSGNPPTGTTNTGGISTSALARDDSYPNGTTTGDVTTNDFGLVNNVNTRTVLSYGLSGSAGTTTLAGNNQATDAGGTINIASNGTFTYTPPGGFTGFDRFKYVLQAEPSLPTDAAIVTIQVGDPVTAVADAYTPIIGNVTLTRNVAQGVLANDLGSGTKTVVKVNGSAAAVGNPVATSQGGTITQNADGSFTYVPPPGFEGNDTYTYAADNGINMPSTATVTLTVSGMIWFVDAAAGGGGNGTLASPFNSIVNFNAGAADDPGDNIFVYENVTAYVGSITLLNSQRLIGQDATATLASITGLGASLNVGSLPAMNLGALETTLTTTAASNAVNLNSVNGANTVRGLTIGNTNGYKISGSSFGTLTAGNNSSPDLKLNGTGGAISLTTGSFGTVSGFVSVSSLNASNTGISLHTVGGTINMGSTTITNPGSIGLDLDHCTADFSFGNTLVDLSGNTGVGIFVQSAGSISFGDLDISPDPNRKALDVDNVSVNITSTSGTISTTNAYAIIGASSKFNMVLDAVSATNAGGSQHGIILNFCTGSLIMNGGAITGGTDIAFKVFGGSIATTYNGNITQNNIAPLLSVSFAHTGTLTFNTGTLSATNGTGLQFDNADGTYDFNGTTTLNGGDAGVDILNGSAGTFTFGTGAAITSPTGIAFNVDGTVAGNTCAITYSGNITQANNFAMVNVINHSVGTILFQTGTLSATNGTGLQFDNADSPTSYNFNGTTTLNGGDAGVDILNGSGGTFNFAVASGSIAITNPSGVGINIQSSSATVNFNSINVNKNASNGNGVVINSNSGPVSFSVLAITTNNGSGLVGTNNTGSITVTTAVGSSISSTNGAAIDVSNTSGNPGINLSFTSITTTNSPVNAINLKNIGGTGLTISGVTTTDMTAGSSYNISLVNCAASTIRIGTDGVTPVAVGINDRGTTGIFMDNCSGTIQFGNTTIANPNTAGGYGIRIDNSSAAVTFKSADISDAHTLTVQTDPDTDLIPNNDGDGDAIFLKNNTGSFTLSGGTLLNSGNDGIDGRTVQNITLTDVTIDTPGEENGGQGQGGHGISFIDLGGTSNLTGLFIKQFLRSQIDGFRAINTNKNATVNVINCRFENSAVAGASDGNDGLFFEGRGSSSMTLVVDEVAPTASKLSRFQGLFGDGIQISTGAVSSGTMSTTVKNTDFKDAYQGLTQTGSGNNGLRIAGVGGGKHAVDIQNNTFLNVSKPLFSQGVISAFINDNSEIKGTISGNTITNATQAGIHVFADNLVGETITDVDLIIQNNTMDNISSQGIQINMTVTGGTLAACDIRILNNNIGQTSPVGDGEVMFGFGGGPNASQEGILVTARGTSKTVNLKVANNNVKVDAAGVNAPFPPANEALQLDVSENAFMSATVTNNQLLQLDDISNGAAFFANVFGTTGNPQMCLDFTTNTGNTATDFFILEQSSVATAAIAIENIATYQATNTGTFSTSGNLVNSAGCPEPPVGITKLWLPGKVQNNALAASTIAMPQSAVRNSSIVIKEKE